MPSPVLESDRVRLRPVEEGDAERRMRYGWHRAIERNYGDERPDGPMSRTEADDWLTAIQPVLGLHRVELRVLAFNTAAIASYQSAGFVIEGRERESCRLEGAWHDDVIMAVLESEHRALRPHSLRWRSRRP